MRMWRFNSKVTPLQTVTGHLLDTVHQPLPRPEGMIIVATSIKVSISTNDLHAAVGCEAELGEARQVRVPPL
eukprot:SAG22_NODE_1325_length_4736_cov_5.253397_2_plen_72_part_00